jgi:hypothetical protein
VYLSPQFGRQPVTAQFSYPGDREQSSAAQVRAL